MKQIHIVQLYINEMNTYGDRGNLLVLARRIEWHGYEPVIHYHHIGGLLPEQIDIVLGGGGQDAAQIDIQNDIQVIAKQLHQLKDAGVPMLMVCGTYQLFANRFVTNTGEVIKGIGIFDAETFGGNKRLIGNIAIETDFAGTIYGFENHSGKTTLNPGQSPLGKVKRGNGNNGDDKLEGARTNNVFGTYSHGPILPNNPVFTDYLISLAVEHSGQKFEPKFIDDSLAEKARYGASRRDY